MHKKKDAINTTVETVTDYAAYLENILRSSTVAIASTDLDLRIRYFNPMAEKIFGYKAGEVIGRTVMEMHIKEKIEHERFEKAIETVRTKGEYRYVIERTDEKGTHFYESRVYGILDKKNRLEGFVLMSHDITERTLAERRVSVQDEKLKQYAKELERSNKELDQFASIASHDLQEPLRIIAGFAQLLRRRYKGKLDSDADDFINYITDGVSRMDRMIKDLLDYSRITTKGKPFAAANCNKTLSRALANLQSAIDESSATVTSDALPTVMADESQLVHLFQNLIGNAIKYRSDKPPVINISAIKDNDFWRFSVRDNGIGIDPQHFDRVFQIFQRLHKREEYPGTGIGLSICKKIVERHKGRIWCESEKGKGSIFYFTLPASLEKDKGD